MPQFPSVLRCFLSFSGFLSLPASPFAWRRTEVVGGHRVPLLMVAYVVFAEGRWGSGIARDEVFGSHRVFGTATLEKSLSVSQFLPRYEWNFVSCCFCNCKTPAQVFHIQISHLRVQGVLSNESCEAFSRVRMCHEVGSNQVYLETALSWRVLTGDFPRSCDLLSVYWLSGTLV